MGAKLRVSLLEMWGPNRGIEKDDIGPGPLGAMMSIGLVGSDWNGQCQLEWGLGVCH